MGKKVLILVMVMAMALSFLLCPIVSAQELVNLQKVRERPVNVLEYVEVGIDVGGTMLSNFLKTTNPLGIYNVKLKHGLSGVKLNLIEKFLHPKLNLVGGLTLKNKEPSHVLFGLELKLKLKGDLGRVLSKFRPGIYWCDDKWWLGASLELRGFGI